MHSSESVHALGERIRHIRGTSYTDSGSVKAHSIVRFATLYLPKLVGIAFTPMPLWVVPTRKRSLKIER